MRSLKVRDRLAVWLVPVLVVGGIAVAVREAPRSSLAQSPATGSAAPLAEKDPSTATAEPTERNAREQAEQADRADDPAGLTRAQRAKLDAHDAAMRGRAGPPPRDEGQLPAQQPENPLSRQLASLVPEGFALIHQDADPRADFQEAVFEQGSIRMTAMLYRERIIDADHTLEVAVGEVGGGGQPEPMGGLGSYVVVERPAGLDAYIALRDGSLLTLSLDGPWSEDADLPMGRLAFERFAREAAGAVAALT